VGVEPVTFQLVASTKYATVCPVHWYYIILILDSTYRGLICYHIVTRMQHHTKDILASLGQKQ
jgi:hypothetical protein